MKTTPITPIPENTNIITEPKSDQMSPPSALAMKATMLETLVKNPIAVANSVLWVIFEIQAFEIPSVAAA